MPAVYRSIAGERRRIQNSESLVHRLSWPAAVIALSCVASPNGAYSPHEARDRSVLRQVGLPRSLVAATVQSSQAGSGQNSLTAGEAASGWILLFDGRTLAGWESTGKAMWTAEEGVIRSRGDVPGYLRTTKTFQNFELKAEFWADETMNSAIFVRCPSDPKLNVSPRTCYEVNIYDPHELWPTGSVNEIQTTLPTRIPTAARWNQYEITLDGTRIMVKLNGKTTVDAKDDRFTSGTIALQANGPGGKGGVINFRNIKIRPL